ncbi:MAG: alpha/beta hydrolase [Pseudomonadota bacterium]
MGQVASFDGLSIHFKEGGSGAPLLLINGFGPPCVWMAEMYGKHFAERFQYVVSDLRGVGRSDRPDDIASLDLEDFARDHLAVMDAMGWERAHIYGGSMGASIATQLALMAPKRVKSLALGSFDCGYPNILSKKYQRVLKTRVRYGKSILSQKTDPEGAARVILETYYGEKESEWKPGLEAFIIAMLKENPMETDFPPLQMLQTLPDNLDAMIDRLPDEADPIPKAVKGSRDFVTGDLWEMLDQVKPKTLLLHGVDDEIVPYQSSVYAVSKIPDAELRLFKPMYHSISGSAQILRDVGDWMLRYES